MDFPFPLGIPELMAALIATLLVLVLGILYWLMKPRMELPLPNETDLGPWIIPLPEGVTEGRMTTARRTFERLIDIATSDADGTKKKSLLTFKEELFNYHLYGFKGGSKCILFSNQNLGDERLSLPMGKEKRLLQTPLAWIDKGEYDGFRFIFLKMPEPETTKMDAKEHKNYTDIGEAIKYIRSAAMNIQKLKESSTRVAWLTDELDLTQKELAAERSEKERSKRALSQKPLSSPETKPVKGKLRTQIGEFFYNGWRLVASGAAGLLTYWICRARNLPTEPMVVTIIVGMIVFLVYPWISRRLE